MFVEEQGFMRWVKVGVRSWDAVAGFLDQFQMVETFVDLDHDIGKRGDFRFFREIGRDVLQCFGCGRLELCNSSVETGVVGGGAGELQPGVRLFSSPSFRGAADDGCAGGTAMEPVMAVDENGTGHSFGGFDEADGLIGGDSIIADGKMDVADAKAVGSFDSGFGTVDSDDGFDTEFFQFGKSFVTFRCGAGVKAVAELKKVFDTLGGQWMDGGGNVVGSRKALGLESRRN